MSPVSRGQLHRVFLGQFGPFYANLIQTVFGRLNEGMVRVGAVSTSRPAGLFALLIALIMLTVSACSAGTAAAPDETGDGGATESTRSAEPPAIAVSDDEFPLVLTDIEGYETELDDRPERVVFLSGTPMNLWYDAGGTAIARPELTDNIKLLEEKAGEMMALPSVGLPYIINAEAVAGYQPDLIVGMDGPHNATIDRFRDLGYNAIVTKVRSFDDLRDTYEAFGVLTGEPEHAGARFAEIEAETEEILSRVPDGGVSAVVLFISEANLAVKLEDSIVGQMLVDLGVTNIATGLTPDNPGSETTPLNLEAIVAEQPDLVLVTSMIGSNEVARQNLEAEFDSNPGWNAIDAIEQGRVAYLPQQYFLYNAGPYYPDALEYLAASIYPDEFGDPIEP